MLENVAPETKLLSLIDQSVIFTDSKGNRCETRELTAEQIEDVVAYLATLRNQEMPDDRR